MSNVDLRQRQSLRQYVDARATRYRNLAQLLGVSAGHVTRLLDGKRRITERQAAVLADFYGEEPAFFLGLSFVGGDE